MCISSRTIFISTGYPSVEPSNHSQNLGDHLTGSLKRYDEISAHTAEEHRRPISMIPSAGLPCYIFPCRKAAPKSPLALHSTAPPSTLSSWKQQRPQSEHINDIYLKRAHSALQAKKDDLASCCVTHAPTDDVYQKKTMSRTNTAFVALRRKRGEKGEVVETVEDVIVRRLTADRIDELKKLIKDTQEKHRYTGIAFETGWTTKCCIINRIDVIGWRTAVFTGSWRERLNWFKRDIWIPNYKSYGKKFCSKRQQTFWLKDTVHLFFSSCKA